MCIARTQPQTAVQNCVQNSSEFSVLEVHFISPVTMRGSQDSLAGGQAGAWDGRSLEPDSHGCKSYLKTLGK